jgi:hypothetical protein
MKFIEKANIGIKLELAILQLVCLCKIASQQASASLKEHEFIMRGSCHENLICAFVSYKSRILK